MGKRIFMNVAVGISPSPGDRLMSDESLKPLGWSTVYDLQVVPVSGDESFFRAELCAPAREAVCAGLGIPASMFPGSGES